MPGVTDQDKVLMLSKLEEGWSVRRVATHYGLNKNSTSKEEAETRRDRD
jgi:hypothetical protein